MRFKKKKALAFLPLNESKANFRDGAERCKLVYTKVCGHYKCFIVSQFDEQFQFICKAEKIPRHLCTGQCTAVCD